MLVCLMGHKSAPFSDCFTVEEVAGLACSTAILVAVLSKAALALT